MNRPRSSRGLLGAALVALVVPIAVPATADHPDQRTVGPAATTDYSSVIATMRQEIPQMMAAAGVTGLTITLVDGDHKVWSQGFGFADRASSRAVTPRTLFHIGSVSKTFTAIAVMQLVKQGRVDLDAPLARYVPRFRLLPRYKNNVITVRSVLDHHSGIPGDVFNGLFTDRKPNPDYRAWLREALTKMYPERRVDTMWAYNNSGFVLLQDLVENVTDQSFRRYTRRHLFRAVGMPASSFDDGAAAADRITRNYWAREDDQGILRTTTEPREFINGWGAGSIRSNALDMARYLRTLLTDGKGIHARVLPTGTLDRMWRTQVDTPLDLTYFTMGLGFALGYPELDWAGRVVMHDGATTWNMSMLQLLPDSDLGVFASMNTAAPENVAAQAATRTLALAYTAKTGRLRPPDTAPPVSPVVVTPPDVAARVVGHYATSHSLDKVALDDAGELVWTRDLNSPTHRTSVMRLMSDGWYVADEPGWPQVQFRTVRGRELMLSRVPWGPAVTEMAAGQKVPDDWATWRRWRGTYRAVDAVKSTTVMFRPQAAWIRTVDGVLVMDDVAEFQRQVLQPVDGKTAVTFGIGPALGRNKGDSVFMSRKNGKTFLTFMGVRYRRTGN